MYSIVHRSLLMEMEMIESSGFPLWEDGMILSKVEE